MDGEDNLESLWSTRMSTRSASDHAEQASALQKARKLIAEATIQFPVSQILVPLDDTLGWLLDDAATEEYWLEALEPLRRRFAPHWERMAQRALGDEPRQVSDQAFQDAEFDPLHGKEPWGTELTQVLRSCYDELEPFGDEANRVFPTDQRTRAFARAVRTQNGRLVLPVLSYAPLKESEWHAILPKITDLIGLTLLFEGAVVVWLIGGFARDVEGRLQLRPQLSFVPPPPGTRVKPLRVLLGTAYEEQCPSLIPLVHAVRGQTSRPSDEVLIGTDWHRLVVQLDIPVEDYVLLNLDRLSLAEREIARQMMYLEQRPRQPHELEGPVKAVPRPWQRIQPPAEGDSLPQSAPETEILPPRAALQAVEEATPAAPTEPPDAQSLQRDAEDLRRKGMASVKTDSAIAQKYLLASTVLENSSVDVWLTLVEIASNEKQKASFRREAEKVLRRQRRDT
jgi:hypothetical protein